LTAEFRQWGVIEVRHFSGEVIRSGGHSTWARTPTAWWA
jgi:hypothetical protein